MKKLFKFATLFLAGALVLTGCDNENKDKPDETKAASYVGGSYYGDYYSNGGENFYMTMNHGVTLTETADGLVPSGEGTLYAVDFVSSSAVNMKPGAETFPVVEKAAVPCVMAGYEFDLGAAMFGDAYAGIYLVPSGSYAMIYNADTLTATKYIVSGNMTFDGNKFVLDVTFDDGTKDKVSCAGTFSFEDQREPEPSEDDNYSWEPTTVSTKNFTYTTCQAGNYGDYYGNGTNAIAILLQGSEALAQIELYTAAGATSINGTYTLAKTQAAGTAMSSPGGDAQYDYPCFIGTDISDQGYATSYYMITGTVTVTDNSVSYNATSYFGSTLTGRDRKSVV